MLEKMLNEIRASGVMQPAILAKRLNTSVELVEAMIDDLKRRGLLNEINLSCGDACGNCSLANTCLPRNRQGRLWQVTKETQKINM